MIFTFDNVITRPYHSLRASDVRDQFISLELYGKPISDQYVKYRKIVAELDMDCSNPDNIFISVNTNLWLHYYNGRLCLGNETRSQISSILYYNQKLSGEDKYKAIYHILGDYFSVCTEEHWARLNPPEDKLEIDEYELFKYGMYKIYHKSNMADAVLDVPKEQFDYWYKSNAIIVYEKPISINFYKACDYCGVIQYHDSIFKCKKCGSYRCSDAI